MSYSNLRTAIYATEEYQVRRTMRNICDDLLEHVIKAEEGNAAVAASATGYSAPPPTWGDALPAASAAWALPEIYRAHEALQMELWSAAFSADSNTTPTPATYFGENLEDAEEDMEEPLRKIRIDAGSLQGLAQAMGDPRQCIRIQDIDWGPLLAARRSGSSTQEREIRIDRFYGC